MKYLNRKDLMDIGINWNSIVDVIVKTTRLLQVNDFSQPVKPYLRYKDLSNRIIAMPAYVGGEVAAAGIKWIASFPKNIEKNIPRAHSVIILNDEATGIPTAAINTPLISGIRTAGVTGAIIRKYVANLDADQKKFNFGIIGFGPIGQLHLEMICGLFGAFIDKIYIYDLKPVDLTKIDPEYRENIVIADSWATAYQNSKIFMTCTVASAPYIDLPPAKGTLQLNVSLRDYRAELLKFMDVVIVDDWKEICRENTDIEQMHLQYGLTKEDVYEITEALEADIWNDLEEKVIMFNPMGMAAFDIAVAKYYYDYAMEHSVGLVLED